MNASGSNGLGRRHPNTTAPVPPWETPATARPRPRDIIAEQIRAEVRRYWWRVLLVAGAIIGVQVTTATFL